MPDEGIVEVDVVGYKDAVGKQFGYSFGNVIENRSAGYHLICNSGQGKDRKRYLFLRIDERFKAVNDAGPVMDYDSDFGNTAATSVAARGFNIDYGVLRVFHIASSIDHGVFVFGIAFFLWQLPAF
ncbi:hypothetical protein D3C86_1621840 [compost metagenome]